MWRASSPFGRSEFWRLPRSCAVLGQPCLNLSALPAAVHWIARWESDWQPPRYPTDLPRSTEYQPRHFVGGQEIGCECRRWCGLLTSGIQQFQHGGNLGATKVRPAAGRELAEPPVMRNDVRAHHGLSDAVAHQDTVDSFRNSWFVWHACGNPKPWCGRRRDQMRRGSRLDLGSIIARFQRSFRRSFCRIRCSLLPPGAHDLDA